MRTNARARRVSHSLARRSVAASGASQTASGCTSPGWRGVQRGWPVGNCCSKMRRKSKVDWRPHARSQSNGDVAFWPLLLCYFVFEEKFSRHNRKDSESLNHKPLKLMIWGIFASCKSFMFYSKDNCLVALGEKCVLRRAHPRQKRVSLSPPRSLCTGMMSVCNEIGGQGGATSTLLGYRMDFKCSCNPPAFWLQTLEVLFRLFFLSLDPACHHHRRRSIGREIGRLTHKSKKLPNGGIERMGRERSDRDR